MACFLLLAWAESEMVERVPRDYLTKVLELSQEMISLASIDPGFELDVGCRTVFGTLFDYGYALKKMAEKELAVHEAAEESPAEEFSPVASISSAANPKTVLIADDDRDFLKYVSSLFQGNGFETLTAVDGHEAIELSATRRPDLIILDVSMPGKSGASVYQELTQDPELGSIPVVLVTASGESPGQLIERSRGVSDPVRFVGKPLDVDVLWEAVRGVFGAPSG
jgi:CheY-like chemotaxis protein